MKLDGKIKIADSTVLLQDMATIYCADERVKQQVCKLPVYSRQNTEVRRVVSIMRVLELILQNRPNWSMVSIGETACVIEWQEKKKQNRIWENCKIIFVALICFFGTSFSIMAYHNDINITNLFGNIYSLALGKEKAGITFMEVAYSLGLSMGILVFFNHVGKRRITKDPTPVEVEMRAYEDSINLALSEIAERENQIISCNENQKNEGKQ